MTKGAGRDIIYKRSREAGQKPEKQERRAILENDTGRRKNEEVRFGEKSERLLSVGSALASAEDARERKRIKHKSLILAQDERWRRA